MAVKASRTVTLYKNPEVTGLVPYFKTVAAGSSAPATPSGTSPSGWSTTEPAFNNSNDLYMSIRTNYSYGDPEYSTPQKYASYEAAKVAYNAATAASSAASETQGNLNDYIASKNLIVGTHTAATRFWTGVSNIEELVDGTEIYFYTGYATANTVAGDRTTGVQMRVNSSTTKAAGTQIVTFEGNNSAGTASNYNNVWLNITLKNGTQTGWIPCYWRSNERQTSHFSAGSSIRYVYRVNAKVGGEGTTAQYTGWWADASYDSGNERDDQIIYFAGKAGAEGVHRYCLFMEDANGTYQSICHPDNTTGTTKTKCTAGFKVNKTIYVNWSNTNYANNGQISGWGAVYTSKGNPIDSRYSFNTKRTTTTTDAGYLVPYKQVYLVGTINDNDGLFYLDDVWWTQTPNQAGKIYVLVGACYDCNASNNRIALYAQNTWYKYNEEWGLIELQTANNNENKKSISGLSANIASLLIRAGTIESVAASLKSGSNEYILVESIPGLQEDEGGEFVQPKFKANQEYYEYLDMGSPSQPDWQYVKMTWNASTQKYTAHDGTLYSVDATIPEGLIYMYVYREGLDKTALDLYSLKKTLVKQTDTNITTWFQTRNVSQEDINKLGDITQIDADLKKAQGQLDIYDQYITQDIDKNTGDITQVTGKYLNGVKYYKASPSGSEFPYYRLTPGVDYTINNTISGTVYTSQHYLDAYLELGAKTSTMRIRIYPEELVFFNGDTRLAYMSNRTLYITESTVLKKESIGNWITTQDDAGNLNTKWVD